MASFEDIFEEDWPSPSSHLTNNENAENQSSNNRTTTNMPTASDTENTKHENSQEDGDIGLQDDETLDKNESEPTDITFATYTNSSKISKFITVEDERNPPSTNEITSPIDECQIKQKLTTNENPTDRYKINSVSLLNPLFSTLSDKTDRSTELKDWFGKQPVLIVCGSLPDDDLDIKMDIISTSSKGDHDSLYYIHGFDSHKFINKLRRKAIFEKIDDFYLIKLDKLFVRKQANYKKIDTEDSKCYNLTLYPSGEKIPVRAKGSTTFADRYDLMQARLAIQFFLGNSKIPLKINIAENEFIFLSNFIGKGPDVQQLPNTDFAKVDITDMTPGGSLISFNNDNESVLEFQIKFTDNFADQLDSYRKCIEISLLDNKFNSIYYIKTDDGPKKVTHMKITHTPFTIPLTIVKQILSEHPDILQAMHSFSQNTATYIPSEYNINSTIVMNGLNKFDVQLRLLPSIITLKGEQIVSYTDAPIWKFGEYTEYLEPSTDIIMQEIDLDLLLSSILADDNEQNSTDTDRITNIAIHLDSINKNDHDRQQ